MRKTHRGGSFLLCLLLNMLLNLRGLLPAAVLLALHFLFDLSVWWAVAAMLVWIVYLILWMAFFGFAAKSSNTPDPPKENRNPYSVRYRAKPNEQTNKDRTKPPL